MANKREVLSTMEYKTDKGTITIEKVKGEEDLITFFVIKGRKREHVTENTIRQKYPWAVHMLPLTPLTQKQKQILQWIVSDDNYSGEDSLIWIEPFSEMLELNEVVTKKQAQGILSSLWVKGYISCTTFLGKGARYFTLEPSAVEYLKSWQVTEDGDE